MLEIMEAFSFRFHPQHIKFKELAKEKSNKTVNFYGNFGMPSFPKNDIRWNKSLGGGVLNVFYVIQYVHQEFFSNLSQEVYLVK